MKAGNEMKRYKLICCTLAAVSLLYLAALITVSSGILFSPEKKMEGIEEAGLSFSELKIPEDARVIAVGEATHGNREFQILKREVLEKLYNEGNGRAIAFEMSAGEAAMINDAIHESSSDLVELLEKQSYPIYDTEEMAELLSFMRQANSSLPYESSLMFYGVDMQGAFTSVEYMQDVCEREAGIFTAEEKENLLSIDTEDTDSYPGNRDLFEKMSERLSKGDRRSRELAILCDVVLEAADAPVYDEQPKEYAKHRDRCMAENLKKYSELEENRGYTQIIITAHNGHVMKGAAADYADEEQLTMGENINRIFEGRYFCIGSEFYRGVVNIHTAGTYDDEYERADHEYCSDDPLAYQARYFEGGRYCLDFTKLKDTESRVYRTAHDKIFNGLVGEGYNALIDISKNYRISCVPAERYDAVVYYYEVSPIDPIHY